MLFARPSTHSRGTIKSHVLSANAEALGGMMPWVGFVERWGECRKFFFFYFWGAQTFL